MSEGYKKIKLQLRQINCAKLGVDHKLRHVANGEHKKLNVT